ncbi:MAG: M12 family metallo-peptidase [Candidatus Binatia bacterium]
MTVAASLFLVPIMLIVPVLAVPSLAAPPAAAGHPAAVRVMREGGRPGAAPVALEVKAFSREFRIRLERNDALVAPGAKLVLAGDQTREVALKPSAWMGTVEGQPGSVVRVSIEGSRVSGFVRSGDEVYVIEPTGEPGKGGEAGHEARLGSEVLAASEPAPCGAEHPASSSASGSTSALAAAVTTTARSAGGPMRLLDVSVVADAQFWNRFGEDAPGHLQDLFNQVDGIYQADLGVALQIRQMVIYTSASAQPFPTTGTSAVEVLGDLAIARSNDPTFSISAGDITHLVLGSDLGGPIGVAWLGGVCDPVHGTGLSQVTSRPGYLATLLVAHEIGHNLGALHDGQPGSGCESVPAAYIMWPTLYTSLDDSFSSCSAGAIENGVSAASCIGEAIPAGCGDGVLDPGEQCDDGNNRGGDCCRLNCTFDLAGVPCAGAGELCWDDVCDGTGTCAAVPNNEPCSSGDACMDAHCLGGECVASDTMRGFSQIKARFRVESNGMLGDGSFTATAPASEGGSDPRTDGLSLGIEVGGAAIYEQFVPPQAWVSKKPGVYMYKTSSPVPGGVRSAKMVIGGSTGQVTYRFRLGRPAMAMSPSTPDFLLLAGNRADGQCGAGHPRYCGYRGTKYLCE